MGVYNFRDKGTGLSDRFFASGLAIFNRGLGGIAIKNRETRWLSYYAKKTQVADDPCLLKMNENGTAALYLGDRVMNVTLDAQGVTAAHSAAMEQTYAMQ